MSIQKKLGIAGIAVFAIMVIAISLVFFNKRTIELSVKDGDVIRVEYSEEAAPPEVTAAYKDSYFYRKGVPVEVTVEGTVDWSALGTYTLDYSANYNGIEKKATVTVIVEDTTAPVIELISDEEKFTSPVATYEEEGFTAIDAHDGDLTASVVREEKDGVVIYTITDSSGNTATAERIIVYKDVIAPVITLSGEAEMKVNLGGAYTEPGYQALDDCDGDISAAVIVDGSIDTSTQGTYQLTYQVQDSGGNTCEVVRTVKVADYQAPSLSLNGKTTIFLKLGETYTEPGYSASDNVEGDITGAVEVSNEVNTSQKGLYIIRYKVTDGSGNTAEASRKVYVYEKQMVSQSTNPGSKVVYLTFDDGPGRHTARLLDILDKYGVKATFFVTNQFPEYRHMIGEAFRRGHTIGVHTYNHEFSDIYRSEEAFFADLQKMEDICVEQTGEKPIIMRFPGGGSNTVSRRYCNGIMSALTESISYHGYLYCDWNVSSGDGAGDISTEKVVSNVINGIQRYNISVVLQHDIYKFSVEAVEEIIVWGLAHGYTFLPMDETTPMIHHDVAN